MKTNEKVKFRTKIKNFIVENKVSIIAGAAVGAFIGLVLNDAEQMRRLDRLEQGDGPFYNDDVEDIDVSEYELNESEEPTED